MLFYAIRTLAPFGLEGFYGVSGLFHRASHEPAHRVLISERVAPFLRCSMATT